MIYDEADDVYRMWYAEGIPGAPTDACHTNIGYATSQDGISFSGARRTASTPKPGKTSEYPAPVTAAPTKTTAALGQGEVFLSPARPLATARTRRLPTGCRTGSGCRSGKRQAPGGWRVGSGLAERAEGGALSMAVTGYGVPGDGAVSNGFEVQSAFLGAQERARLAGDGRVAFPCVWQRDGRGSWMVCSRSLLGGAKSNP